MEPFHVFSSLWVGACGTKAPPAEHILVALSELVDVGRVERVESAPVNLHSTVSTLPVLKLVHRPIDLAELVLYSTGGKSPSIVNLGAGHYAAWDANVDPTYKIAVSHPGSNMLFVEANEVSLKATVDKLTEKGARIASKASLISPHNIVSTLAEANMPLDMDLLKIDIDSFDYHIVRTILLSGYRPTLIATEVNPDLAPPLLFTPDYDPNFAMVAGGAGFFGCSASLWAELGREFGYTVLQGDGLFSSHDLVLLKTTAIPVFETKYNIALDPLTAFHMMRTNYVDKDGAHWKGPRPGDVLIASEKWGGALEALPQWREQLYLRSVVRSKVYTDFFVDVDSGN